MSFKTANSNGEIIQDLPGRHDLKKAQRKQKNHIDIDKKHDRDLSKNNHHQQHDYEESLLLNLPPLLAPLSSSSSSSPVKADMAMSDKFGVSLTQRLLLKQSFVESQSYQQHENQDHLIKPGPSQISVYNCQMSFETANFNGENIQDLPGRHDLKKAQREQKKHIDIDKKHDSDLFKNNNHQQHDYEEVPRPLEHMYSSKIIFKQLLFILIFITLGNNTECRSTASKEPKTKSDAIKSLHIVSLFFFASLLCAIYCLYRKYIRSTAGQLNERGPIISNVIMIVTLVLQILNEFWHNDFVLQASEYAGYIEFLYNSAMIYFDHEEIPANLDWLSRSRLTRRFRFFVTVFSLVYIKWICGTIALINMVTLTSITLENDGDHRRSSFKKICLCLLKLRTNICIIISLVYDTSGLTLGREITVSISAFLNISRGIILWISFFDENFFL